MSYQDAATAGDSGHRRRRRTIGRPTLALVVLAGGLMAGCSSGSGPGTTGAAGSPEGQARPSLELASPKSPGSGGAGAMEIYVGTLGSDAIEGGCTYLQAADGQRFEVIYPDGWQVHRSPLELVGPDGRVVAGAGDQVTIRGAPADMMSICQIGPIIRAVEVMVAG